MIAFWWISFLHVLRYFSCASPLCPKRAMHTSIYLGQSLSLCTTGALKLYSNCTCPEGKCQHVTWSLTPGSLQEQIFLKLLFWCEVVLLRSHTQTCTMTLHADLFSGLKRPLIFHFFSSATFQVQRVCLSAFLCVWICVHSYMFVCIGWAMSR